MATILDNTPEQQLHIQLQERRSLAFGFLWGAAALFIFAVWFWLKPLPGWLVLSLIITGGVSLFACFYHMLATGGVAGAPGRLARLRAEQRTFGLATLFVSALLLLAALWLGISHRLEAFGEALSLGLFALVGLEAGRRLLAPPQAAAALSERLIVSLGSSRKPIGLGLFFLGAILALAGLWVRFKLQAEFPEFGGLLLLGFVAIPAGLYLYLAQEVNVRVFVLIVGGLCGLVIAVMVLARIWLWRDLFMGGLAKWRGEEAWKIWLCAYLELFGLVLMLGSVMLARGEVRSQPTLRLALYGYNSVLTGLLLLAFLVVLNILIYVLYPLNFDWTAARGLYALSPSSEDILQKLNQPVKLYVLLSQRFRGYKDIHNLLDNAQAITDKLQVEYISPDQDFRKYDTLAQKYPELLPDVRSVQEGDNVGRGILVVFGPEAKDQKPMRALIPPRKILDVKRDMNPGQPRPSSTLQFLGESSLMTELQFFMEGQKKSKVYFLQGDDELDIMADRILPRPVPFIPMKPLGAAKLVDRLKKENLEVIGLSFDKGKDSAALIHVTEDKDKRKQVPADARAVIIAGASQNLTKEALDALDRYMEKNGRLIVLVPLVTDQQVTELKRSNLDDFLKKFDVSAPPEFVLRAPLSQADDPIRVIATAPEEADNVLAKKFRLKGIPFNWVRVVRPLGKTDKYKAEVLLEVPIDRRQLAWAENKVQALRDPFRFSLIALKQGAREPSDKPIPVAVAVREGEKPRLVVIGDAEFVSNAGLTRLDESNFPETYFNFLASALDWLAERPGVGARPKETGRYTISPEAIKNESRMANLPAWLMALCIIGLGTGLWVVRRR